MTKISYIKYFIFPKKFKISISLVVRTPRSNGGNKGSIPLWRKFFYDKEIENIKINNELEDKEKKIKSK